MASLSSSSSVLDAKIPITQSTPTLDSAFHRKDLAFTYKGWVLEDKMVDRRPNEIITAQFTSTTRFTTVVQRYFKWGNSNPKLSRDPSVYTKEELAPPGADTMSYLVVGYISWRDAAPYYRINVDTATICRGIIGHDRPQQGIKSWNRTEFPLLVVTPIPSPVNDGLPKFYALLNPQSDLCTPFEINMDKSLGIYWRWEFRSNSRYIARRVGGTLNFIHTKLLCFILKYRKASLNNFN